MYKDKPVNCCNCCRDDIEFKLIEVYFFLSASARALIDRCTHLALSSVFFFFIDRAINVLFQQEALCDIEFFVIHFRQSVEEFQMEEKETRRTTELERKKEALVRIPALSYRWTYL